MLQEKSLMRLRSQLLQMTKPDKQEDVAAILILAFRKYQQNQLSRWYFDYSLMPQLIPLLNTQDLTAAEDLLTTLIQIDDS